jgi:hypothetical protein
MRRLHALLVLLAGLASLAGGTGCRRRPPPPRPEPVPPVRDAARAPARDPAIGFHLISWQHQGEATAAAWRTAVEQLAEHGVDHVSFAPIRFVDPETGGLTLSGVDHLGKAQELPHLSQLAAGLERARQLRLRVTVVPFVEPVGYLGWRGELDLAGPPALRFFDEYRDYLVEVARMAEASGAARLAIGTELRTLVGNPLHSLAWTELIDEVGAIFSGQLGYAASWDDYQDAVLTEVVWEHPRIDFLGIDAYFPLVSADEARVQGRFPDRAFITRLASRWNRLLDTEVLPFAACLHGGAGLPVVLTEYGLVPFDGTAAAPSSDAPEKSGLADPDEQLAGFAGLLAALSGRGREVPEVLVWHWGMPGAEGSLWYLHPEARDVPSNRVFDESLGRRAARYLTGYARGELTVLGHPAPSPPSPQLTARGE